MTTDISWDRHAILQGTQARNPRADREESLGAASREGRAWHWRCRPHEGRRPYSWRVLRAFRFAGGPGDRGFHACDGSINRALAKIGGTDPAGEAPGHDREHLSDAASPRRSRPRLLGTGAGRGNRPREPEDAKGVRGQAGADDRYARRAASG